MDQKERIKLIIKTTLFVVLSLSCLGLTIVYGYVVFLAKMRLSGQLIEWGLTDLGGIALAIYMWFDLRSQRHRASAGFQVIIPKSDASNMPKSALDKGREAFQSDGD